MPGLPVATLQNGQCLGFPDVCLTPVGPVDARRPALDRGREHRYDLAGTYAAICFVVLVSICFFAVTGWVERWLRPGD